MDRSSCSSSLCLQDPRSLAQQILAAVREPFLVLDPEARVLAATDAFLVRFGLSTDEVVGRPLAGLGHGEWEVPELRELFARRAPAAEQVDDYPVRLRSPLLPDRDLLLSVRTVRTGHGRVERFLVAVAEAPAPPAAPTPDDLVRLAAEHSADLLALYSLDGVCRHISPSCEAILGYSREELLRISPCALLQASDRERLIAEVEHLAEGRPPRALVLRARRRDGRRIWLETVLRAARDADGAPVVHAAGRDVTDRERAEEALRWSARQNRAILEGAAEGILGVSAGGRITFANAAAARIVGGEAGGLVGRTFGELLHAPAGAAAWGGVGETLRDGVARAGETMLRRDGRAPVPVEVRCTATRAGAHVAGAVVTFRDLSEQRLGEAARRQASWLSGVEEMAVSLRHQVSAPLTTLLAEAALLEMGGHDPGQERDMVRSMVEAARRIGDVVRRLADQRSDAPDFAATPPAHA